MIARKIIQTGGVQIISVGLGVIMGVFVAKLLGPEGRGVFAIFKANIDLLLLLLSFGIGSVITYYVSNKEIKLSKILGISILVIGFVMSVFLILILVMSFTPSLKGVFFPDNYDGVFFQFFVGISLFAGLLINIISGILNGKKLFNQTNLFKLLHSVVLLLMVVVIYYYASSTNDPKNIEIVFQVTIAAVLLKLTLLAVSLYKKLRTELSVSFRIRNEIGLAFGFINIVYFSELLNFLNYRLDIWLVEYYASLYDLGLYSLAVGISQFLWLIVTPITMVMMPYLNDPALDQKAKTGTFLFYSRILFVSLLLVSTFIFIVADWIVPLVYGEAFANSSVLLKYLLPGIVFSSMTKILGIYILTSGNVKYNLIAVSIGLFFTVLLDLILIPTQGTIGASIATSVSYFFIFLTCFLTVTFKLRVGFNVFIPTKKDLEHLFSKIPRR